MRKVKLQMQQTPNGFVCGPGGELDWTKRDWDDELKNYVIKFTEPVDTIILGRKLAEGFIPHWASAVTDPKSADVFAHKMNDTQKIVFSKTLKQTEWPNTKLANGDLADEIARLKSQPGKDIVVYGGAEFVSNLIQQGLIDELHLFVNPTAIATGKSIFKDTTKLNLVKSRAFSCGVVVLNYEPSK